MKLFSIIFIFKLWLLSLLGIDIVICCILQHSAFARCLFFCLSGEEVVLLPGGRELKELFKQNNKKMLQQEMVLRKRGK